MNLADALVLTFLGILDLGLLAQLRRNRSRTQQQERIRKSLQFAVRFENGDLPMPVPAPLLICGPAQPQVQAPEAPQQDSVACSGVVSSLPSPGLGIAGVPPA